MRKMANGFQTEMNKAMSDPLDVKGTEKKAAAAKRGDVDPSKGTTTTPEDAEADGTKAETSSADGAPRSGSSGNGSTTNGSTADEATGDTPAVSD
jgi:hypothetical protein